MQYDCLIRFFDRQVHVVDHVSRFRMQVLVRSFEFLPTRVPIPIIESSCHKYPIDLNLLPKEGTQHFLEFLATVRAGKYINGTKISETKILSEFVNDS